MSAYENTELPLVMYGAGKRSERELKTLRERGVSPVCICDADGKKWGTTHLGLPIISIEEAKNTFGDFLVHVSIAPPLKYEVCEQLTNSGVISRQRIVNYEPFRRYTSCWHLENLLIVGNGTLFYCCYLGIPGDRLPKVAWQENTRDTVEAFIEYRDRLITALQDPEQSTPCSGCPELKTEYWNAERKVRNLTYGTHHPCQFKCVYCMAPNTGKNPIKAEARKALDRIDFVELLDTLEEMKQIELSYPLMLAAGEITINPKRDALLDTASRYPLEILTNGAIFNEKVASLIARRDGSFLFLSLDSGTRETFHRIKGLDLFDQVVGNIKRYTESGGEVRLKYIITENNCGNNDIDGFIRLCRESEVQAICISCDVKISHDNLPENIIGAAVRLARNAHANSITAEILPLFGEKCAKEIRDRIANKG